MLSGSTHNGGFQERIICYILYKDDDYIVFLFRNKSILILILILPSAISELFISNSAVYKYNTRNRTKLRQCFGKHEYMYRSFKFSAVYIWNALLDSINTHSSYHTFKKTLKLFLLNNTLTYRLN